VDPTPAGGHATSDGGEWTATGGDIDGFEGEASIEGIGHESLSLDDERPLVTAGAAPSQEAAEAGDLLVTGTERARRAHCCG
jgi:hypothetical protein